MDTLMNQNAINLNDTTKIIDTVLIKNINDTLSIHNVDHLNYLPIIIPIVTFVLGYLLTLLTPKLFEYFRIRKVKKYLIFSLELLEKGNKAQVKYIEEFKKQFEGENLFKNAISLNGNFHTKNIQSITNLDLYRIFVSDSNLKEKNQAKVFSEFNYVMITIEKAFNKIETTMDEASRKEEEYIFKINDYIHEVAKILFQFLHIRTFGTTPNNVKDFSDFAKKLMSDYEIKYKKSDSKNDGDRRPVDTIFRKVEEIYKPLSSEAHRLRITDVNVIILELNTWYKNYLGHRDRYYRTYNNFIYELKNADDSLRKVLKVLKKKRFVGLLSYHLKKIYTFYLFNPIKLFCRKFFLQIYKKLEEKI